MHGTQSDPVVLFIGNIRNDQEGKVAVKETKMLGGDFYDILWRVVIILKRDQEGTNEPRAPTPKSSCVRARGGSAPGVCGSGGWKWGEKTYKMRVRRCGGTEARAR